MPGEKNETFPDERIGDSHGENWQRRNLYLRWSATRWRTGGRETIEDSATEFVWSRRVKVGISFEKAAQVRIKLMGTPFEDDQTCGLQIQPILHAS